MTQVACAVSNVSNHENPHRVTIQPPENHSSNPMGQLPKKLQIKIFDGFDLKALSKLAKVDRCFYSIIYSKSFRKVLVIAHLDVLWRQLKLRVKVGTLYYYKEIRQIAEKILQTKERFAANLTPVEKKILEKTNNKGKGPQCASSRRLSRVLQITWSSDNKKLEEFLSFSHKAIEFIEEQKKSNGKIERSSLPQLGSLSLSDENLIYQYAQEKLQQDEIELKILMMVESRPAYRPRSRYRKDIKNKDREILEHFRSDIIGCLEADDGIESKLQTIRSLPACFSSHHIKPLGDIGELTRGRIQVEIVDELACVNIKRAMAYAYGIEEFKNRVKAFFKIAQRV